MSSAGAAGDAAARQQALSAELEAFIPQLYRTVALYLQVLRQGLPPAVDQACFHLATQVHGGRYARLSLRRRRHLHQRLRALVQRCNSLLTVEQLAGLAARMADEPAGGPAGAQRVLLERLRRSAVEEEMPLPEGSVRLQLELPIDADLGSWLPAEHLEQAHRGFDEGEEQEQEEESDALDRPAAAAALLEAMAAALSGALGELNLFGLPPQPPTPWSSGGLPRDPVLLVHWLEGLEQALIRRLRNLSHAINVELEHAGLSSGLLPMGLLDAVLDGQVDSQSAPANVLRLELPLGLGMGPGMGGMGQLQASAVLLRTTDLELEEPRLRTCRHRLLQKRQELRRMAGQFRRLQRRLEAREAERLWQQDIQTERRGQGPALP